MDDSVTPSADASAFVDKWRGAWPEWAIAEVFVPPAERALAPYWQALQFELQEAAWGGADARPGEAKLAWWGEELAGWAAGRRRHPLGVHLLARPAPWSGLASALPALAASRARPADAATAWSSLEPVAAAVADCDAALLGGRADAAAVAAGWLSARLVRHPADAVPIDVTPAGWARQLLQSWPSGKGDAATRRLELALARGRLRSANPAASRGPIATLWSGWRAARD